MNQKVYSKKTMFLGQRFVDRRQKLKKSPSIPDADQIIIKTIFRAKNIFDLIFENFEYFRNFVQNLKIIKIN